MDSRTRSGASPTEWARQLGPDTELRLHVRPGAKKAGVVGTHGDRLKIAITAPPIDGKANGALIELLAGLLGLPQRQLHLHSGATSREKVVRVEAVSADVVVARLAPQE